MQSLHPIAEPFPHLILDDFWPPELLEEVSAEFPVVDDDRWKHYGNGHEIKMEGPPHLWGEATRGMFDRMNEMAGTLEEAFGIRGLHMETIGGGYHLIPPGGKLDIHTDFNRSPGTQRYRRLNLLVYLNHGWTEEAGSLELWDDDACRVRIAPEFNRTVVFATSSRSWHGHPQPSPRWRRSIAAYWFTDNPPPGYTDLQSTVWHASCRP